MAAFAVGLALGMEPLAATRLGCLVASDSVTRSGTQASYPDRDGAAALMSSAMA